MLRFKFLQSGNQIRTTHHLFGEVQGAIVVVIGCFKRNRRVATCNRELALGQLDFVVGNPSHFTGNRLTAIRVS